MSRHHSGQLALDWGEAHLSPSSGQELLEVRTNVYGADVLQLYDDDARWASLRTWRSS